MPLSSVPQLAALYLETDKAIGRGVAFTVGLMMEVLLKFTIRISTRPWWGGYVYRVL